LKKYNINGRTESKVVECDGYVRRRWGTYYGVANINKFYGYSGTNINKFYGDSGANINKFYGYSGANINKFYGDMGE